MTMILPSSDASTCEKELSQTTSSCISHVWYACKVLFWFRSSLVLLTDHLHCTVSPLYLKSASKQADRTDLHSECRSDNLHGLVRRVAIQIWDVATMRMAHLYETVGDLCARGPSESICGEVWAVVNLSILL